MEIYLQFPHSVVAQNLLPLLETNIKTFQEAEQIKLSSPKYPGCLVLCMNSYRSWTISNISTFLNTPLLVFTDEHGSKQTLGMFYPADQVQAAFPAEVIDISTRRNAA